jgi:hypothetical protein
MSTRDGIDPSSLRQKLEELERAKTVLDSLDDEVSKRIPLVEAALSSLKLGVPVSLTLEEHPDQGSGLIWSRVLRFHKHGKYWRLVVEAGLDTGDESDWSETLLADSSREVRVEAIARLPEFIDAAIMEVTQKTVARRGAVADVDKVLELFGDGNKKPKGGP